MTGSDPPWRIDLGIELSSVRRARQFAVTFAREFHLDGLSPDLALVTSELVSNAVRHARSAITVVLRQERAGEVQVEVSDDGGGEPEVRHPDPFTETGRGLLVVEGLARRWGTARLDGRMTVWAVVAGAAAGT